MCLKTKPILITGSHRSGSTWVGKTISTSSKVFYIHEPLNKQNQKKYFDTNFDIWFPYINESNEYIFREGYDKLLNGRFSNYRNKSVFIKEQVKLFIKSLNLKRAYLKRKRFLFKDPIAIFASEWLFYNYDCSNIILIRHPAAFVSSLKKNNWSHDFSDFYKQPDLLNSYLKQFKLEIDYCANNDCCIINQGVLLWNIIHSYILEMKIKHPEWYFIKHEDLSKNPICEFKKIFYYLHLPWNEKTESYIMRTTSAKNISERSDRNIHELNRDSKSNVYNWKKRLTKHEIQLIKEKTDSISSKLYGEDEW